MFYFFKRERDTLTCELRPAASGAGYDILIMEPGQAVVSEHYATSAEVHKRWLQLQERFKSEGWWGPGATHDQ